MRRLLLAATLATAAPLPSALHAQPVDFPIAAADGTPLPPGVSIRKDKTGSVYVDRQGRVLYGMDMRTVLRWAPNPAKYCTESCKSEWKPLLAPSGAAINVAFPQAYREEVPKGIFNPQKAPDWTVISGVDGAQWVYKGWHVVFTHRTDARSTAYDGAGDRTWNTLKYVPPKPALTAPATVETRFVEGRYVLTDTEGRLLFTGKCSQPCTWTGLPAPMASHGIGTWTVSLAGDAPQWALKGKPVFVGTGNSSDTLPPGATSLRP